MCSLLKYIKQCNVKLDLSAHFMFLLRFQVSIYRVSLMVFKTINYVNYVINYVLRHKIL